MFDRLIEKYFTHDHSYRIADKPVFSIFDYPTVLEGLSGSAATGDAFAWMRQRCAARGLACLALQAIARGRSGVEAGTKLALGTEAATATILLQNQAVMRLGSTSAE